MNKTTEDISNGQAITGFGREWNSAHEALGGRSILGDPRSKVMQKNLNKVKYRESFRPFAPSIQRDHSWFDINLKVHIC